MFKVLFTISHTTSGLMITNNLQVLIPMTSRTETEVGMKYKIHLHSRAASQGCFETVN